MVRQIWGEEERSTPTRPWMKRASAGTMYIIPSACIMHHPTRCTHNNSACSRCVVVQHQHARPPAPAAWPGWWCPGVSAAQLCTTLQSSLHMHCQDDDDVHAQQRQQDAGHTFVARYNNGLMWKCEHMSARSLCSVSRTGVVGLCASTTKRSASLW